MDTRKLLSYVRRAVDDYQMIRAGDRIAVGVSAGKDSLTLLCALAEMRRFYPQRFELVAITVDMGFAGTDLSPVAALCAQLNVPYHVAKTDIAEIIFDVRKEKNPCALCAKMRRGVLHNKAKDLGCNVVALGHHFDDVVDTFMMNLFYEGRIGCFQPVTDLSRSGLRLIRPLMYMPEKDVLYFSNREKLPVVKSKCPADGNTTRAEVHKLLSDLERQNDGLRYRIFGALQRGEIDGFKPAGRLPLVKSDNQDQDDHSSEGL